MSFYIQSGNNALSDFKTYYLDTSSITFDLYVKGLIYFYQNDLLIDFNFDEQLSTVTASLADVQNYEKNKDTLISKNFCKSLHIRSKATARSAIFFSKVYLSKRYDLFDQAFSVYLKNIVSLMATANFYPNYVDPDDEAISSWIDQFDKETALTLHSQPAVCPFLKLVEFGRLKVQAGIWNNLDFATRRMFLCNIDVTDYFGLPNLVERYLSKQSQDKYLAKKNLFNALCAENVRKKNIINLRKKAVNRYPSDLAELFFTAIDAEEIRHYWQARFLLDASRIALLIGLSLSNTPLDKIVQNLKEI